MSEAKSMRTIKASELTGAALDWVVNKCEGGMWDSAENFLSYHEDEDECGKFHYSTDWAQGGPIIERVQIDLNMAGVRTWRAKTVSLGRLYDGVSTSPLEAAMRCYVASKLGDTVEVPKELIYG